MGYGIRQLGYFSLSFFSDVPSCLQVALIELCAEGQALQNKGPVHRHRPHRLDEIVAQLDIFQSAWEGPWPTGNKSTNIQNKSTE